MRGDTAEAARQQMVDAFPKATKLHEAAETVGTTMAKDVRDAGFDVVHYPTRPFANHARVVHPLGVEGFSAENLEELAKKFVNAFLGSGGPR